MPGPGEQPQLDYNSPVFTNYINPLLDKFQTSGNINITATIDHNLNVNLVVSGDPTAIKIQGQLKPLANKMTQTLQSAAKSGIIEKPELPVTWHWIQNYG